MVLDSHGDVMSKSKGNVVSPEDMIAGYGADAVRTTMLFMGPPDKEKLWNEDGLAGIYKFLNRVWRQVCDLAGVADDETLFAGDEASVDEIHEVSKKVLRERHRVVGKVAEDFDRNNFNTAIAAIMELSNVTGEYLRKASLEQRCSSDHAKAFDADLAETLVKLLAPIAPHWAEELWHAALGHTDSVHSQAWPAFDPEMAKADEVEIAVQVNGKVKARIMVAADAAEDDVRAAGLAAVESAIAGKEIKKAIVVPGRLVNIVAK